MIMDESLEFADAATATATGTANFGDVIDLGTGSATDPGHGETVYLVVMVATTVTSAGAATVAFQLASDSSTSLATNGTQTIHFTSAAIGKASLTAGTQVLCVPLPSGDLSAYERYLGCQIIIGTAALTAGAFDAFLTKDPRRIAHPADAVN